MPTFKPDGLERAAGFGERLPDHRRERPRAPGRSRRARSRRCRDAVLSPPAARFRSPDPRRRSSSRGLSVRGLKPAFLSKRIASARLRLATSGSAELAGPAREQHLHGRPLGQARAGWRRSVDDAADRHARGSLRYSKDEYSSCAFEPRGGFGLRESSQDRHGDVLAPHRQQQHGGDGGRAGARRPRSTRPGVGACVVGRRAAPRGRRRPAPPRRSGGRRRRLSAIAVGSAREQRGRHQCGADVGTASPGGPATPRGATSRTCSSAARNSSASAKRSRGILRERAQDDRVERRRDGGFERARRARRLGEVAQRDAHDRLALERDRARSAARRA